jgi:4-aminobutyrate aminotransferase-like enzyme
MTRIGSILEARRRLLGRNLSIAYEKPLNIVRGEMQYLFDDEGRRYLDAYNNVAHVGHCHPKVVAAGQEQMALLNTNTRYLNELIIRYAERLTATLPEPLSVCYFVNSGSEANELALRLARAHTKARDLIVLEHAYHGNTTTLIDISPYKHDGPGGDGPPAWVHKAPLPTTKDDAQMVVNLATQLKPLCGFIAESMPSVAGQIILPDGYLKNVYDAVRAAGGVCIADEVQTGLGRIGTHFWAFEKYGVVPDIVVLGKPIGNGHPIAAVITTPDIAGSFDNGMEFFSTFGGNNVSCAIGLAVLEVVQEEKLQSHALQVGEHLLSGLRDLQQRHEIIRDVRGSGLFLGVELRNGNAPATSEANRIVNRMREHGILFGTDGPSHNVLKIRPPMPFSIEDADLLISTLAETLFVLFRGPSRG